MKINLSTLYDQINRQLKGTGIPNDGVVFKTIVHIPDDELTGKLNPIELQFDSMAMMDAVANEKATLILNLKLARPTVNVDKRT